MSTLKEHRTAAGLTQQQLSDASGVNIRQIQNMESGKIKMENVTAKNLLALADALGVDPHDLL
jgi:transcriptional regulator with XRE-family HTH domain